MRASCGDVVDSPESEYEKFQQDQFSVERNFDYGGDAVKTLVIASSARSGSHLLGRVLHSTNRFGDPLEYMQASHIEQWKRRYGTQTAAEALRALQADRTSPNGVFAIKLHYSHLVALGGVQMIPRIFPAPHVVIIRRRNVLKQAISYAIAKQSGLWIGDVPEGEDLAYDARAIDDALVDAVQANANWRFDLARSGLPTLEIDHEDVIADVPSIVKRIARFLSVDLEDESIPRAPVTRPQSSSLNETWRLRYLQDRAGRESHGVPGGRTFSPRFLSRLRRRG